MGPKIGRFNELSEVEVDATADQLASEIPINSEGTPDIDNLEELLFNTGSVGIFHSTDGIITDEGATKFQVSAGAGLLRLTGTTSSPLISMEWNQTDILYSSLVSGTTYYIYIENIAGTPTVQYTSNPVIIDHVKDIDLGFIWFNDENLIFNAPIALYNLPDRQHEAMAASLGYNHVSGAAISESANLKLALTASSWYYGYVPLPLGAIDTNVSDTFTYFHRNGGIWTEVPGQTSIDVINYNDTSSGLSALTVNRYGAHWVFLNSNGGLYVVYGTEDYTVVQIDSATVPNTLPPQFDKFCKIVGKVIVQKNGASFYSIESPFVETFTAGTPTVHNNLSGLNDGDYKHLTAVEKVLFDTIESGADVTDSINVESAGAVMESDTSTTLMQYVLDEDNMGSDSNTKLATQQSIKKYVDDRVVSSVNYQGGYNASTNTPDLDTSPSGVQKGDMYTVTVAGIFFTINVEIGDVIIAEIDNALIEVDWTIVNKNLDAVSIKSAYESNADTNEFSDAEQTIVGNTSGTNTGDQILRTDETLPFTDNSTNDVGTSKHGFFPKLPTSTGKFFKDDGTWADPTTGGTTIVAESFNSSVAHLTTDADAGKEFTITSFPAHCQITKIRARADWTAGQQANTGSALVNNVSGILPAGTALAYDGAIADFAVGDYIWVDDECMRVSVDSGTVLTVVRGLKGTVDAFHNDNTTIVKANHGIRLVVFKDSNRNYSERIIELSSIMTYKGVTDAAITATDDYFGLTADIQNIGHNDFIVIEDTVDEICRIQNVNHDTVSATYDYTIFVQDELAAHNITKDVKKLMVYDLDTPYDSDTTLYCTIFVDEAEASSTVNVDVEIFTDSYT